MKQVKYWILATRPQTLIASIGPVLISTIFSYKFFNFNLIIFLFIIISSVLIQIMTNFINDLYDFKKGADTSSRLGPKRMVQSGHISQKEMKLGALIALVLSVLSGFYLVLTGGWPILLIGLSGFLFAYLYTATRFSIAYNGLGEVFVFLYFGIIASIGTFYIYNLEFNFQVLLIGFIFGFLNTSLLVINNLRDYDADKLSKKYTTAVIFGKTFAKIELFLINMGALISLYFFLESVNKNFMFSIVFIMFIMFLLYKLMIDDQYLYYKALRQFSCYLISITIFLSFILLYDF